MIQFQISFEGERVSTPPEDFEAALQELEVSLPAVVNEAHVKRVTEEHSGRMGLEVLPLIEVLLGAPAILLFIREVSKIIQTKVSKKSLTVFRRKLPDGEIREIKIESDRLSTKDAELLLGDFFSK